MISTITKLKAIYSKEDKLNYAKEILGKERCIYKIQGDRKEYVKHKGKLTTIKDYKALIKQKAKKTINRL